MPRITRVRPVVADTAQVASMRPGRYAPDNAVINWPFFKSYHLASMRPGRYAPDNTRNTAR